MKIKDFFMKNEVFQSVSPAALSVSPDHRDH